VKNYYFSRHKIVKEQGFTLLEIIVVLGIIVVLFTVLSPAIINSKDDYIMDKNLNAIASSMRLVRAHAIKTQQPQIIQFNLDDKTYRIEHQTARKINREIDLSVFTSTSELSEDGKNANIRFYPDGSSSGGRITLTMGNDKSAVDVVWITGQVNILHDTDE